MRKIIWLMLCLLPLLSFAREVDVLCINDLHGSVMSWEENLGMAKLATVVKSAVKRNPNTIVVFGGDNYTGSPITKFFHGAPVNDLMRELHVAASAVGNHEFDYGGEYLSKLESKGHFSFVAANIFYAKSNRPVTWAKPYVMVKKSGIKIAFIGLATQDTPYTVTPGEAKGLVFKDAAICAQHWIDYLKAGKDPHGKPDVIIALTHIPSAQDFATGKITDSKELFSLCKNVKGLDAVISAHSHRIVHGFVNHIPVVQGYCYGRAISYLKIMLDAKNKVIKIVPKVDLVYKRKSRIIPDKQAKHIFDHYMKLLPASYTKVIAVSTDVFRSNVGKLKSHPFDVWACSLLQKDFHADMCMMNNQLIRADLSKGPVTPLEFKRIICFPDKIIIVRLSGASIYQLLEKCIPYDIQFSGIKVYYDLHAKHHQVKKIVFHGKPLQKNKYYSIVINDFMLAGGDHEDFSQAIGVVHTHKLINQELMRLIKQQKIIHPHRVNNLIIMRHLK